MKKIRYAVVGLGWIAQESVLPAFANAENSELTALVSDDPQKLKKLGAVYGVRLRYSYERYEECLRSGEIDAVYIALPNDMHADFTIRAAQAGIHVLCEKPMAVTEEECRRMIDAARTGRVRLMIAYRLHFEKANLCAADLARSGKLGEVRLFHSVFSMPVYDEDNIRLQAERGGGPLYDIGVYCINAARHVFGAEPEEVFSWAVRGTDSRFMEVDEMTSAVLRFPGKRFASFMATFSGVPVTEYRVIGTAGDLQVSPAYSHSGDLGYVLRQGGKTFKKTFPARDQFAPQLIHFSRCVSEGREAEPSGLEGLADVRVIRALIESQLYNRPVSLAPFEAPARPTLEKEMKIPAAEKPEMIHAEAPGSK